jgi:hypothetical protein
VEDEDHGVVLDPGGRDDSSSLKHHFRGKRKLSMETCSGGIQKVRKRTEVVGEGGLATGFTTG